MKVFKVLAVTAAMTSMLAAPALADVSTDIYYNGELLNTTQPVINVDGRVLLAFRDLFENLDGEVNWSEEYRMASVTYGKNTINLFPDTGAVQVNGVPQSLAVGPQMIQDRVYLPLRFVAQSLGGTVDYTKGENDTGIIKINTIDSVENFVQQEGNITKILRTTKEPTNSVQPSNDTNAAYQQWKNNNSAYFIDDHGSLVEVQSYDQKIQVNVIDLTNAKVDTKTYNTDMLYPALTSVNKEGKIYNIGINETASSNRYAGVGTPTGNGDGVEVETDQGDLRLYSGQITNSVFRYDASTNDGGVTSITTTGKVLDLVNRINDTSQTSYAVASNGNYGFLLDGQLLIVDEDGDVKEDTFLTKKMGDAKIFAVGDRFIIIGVNKEMRYPELYAAVYQANGSLINYFNNISNIGKPTDTENFYEYNNLRIIDIAIDDSNVYVLAKTDMDYYTFTYDFIRNTSTKERLSIKEKIYDGFIHTMDDIKLFAADDDYFYLRDIH